MKNRFKKILSSTLALAMITSVVPTFSGGIVSAQDTDSNAEVSMWLEDVAWAEEPTTGCPNLRRP